MGLATFVRTSVWQPLTASAMRLNSLVTDGHHSSQLRKLLWRQSDAVLLVLLEHVLTGARLVVGNTHLHWDPNVPHVKAAQAELAATALRQFAETSRDVPRGGGGGRGDEPPPAAGLVLAGDFNSVPHSQPEFFDPAKRRALPSPMPADWRGSAVYTMLSRGEVAADHPEHPDSFLSPKSSSAALGRPLRTGLALRDAYAGGLCDGPLPLSTHAGDFFGNLDYIWVSPGGEPPPTADEAGAPPGALAPAPAAAVRVEGLLSMPYALDEAEAIGPIPNAQWPSDHLCLGAKLVVEPA